MNNKILNITGGDYFNNYFLQKTDAPSVAFCEVMMDGNSVSDIYSEDFINLRSQELNVSKTKYISKMSVYKTLNENLFHELHLWFGKDTFCQMNLLTLLAYLEHIDFSGKVILNYIDDETFETIESDIDVKLGIYKKLYKDILIHKHIPDKLGVLIDKSINLYFDYHSDTGALTQLVRNNAGMGKIQLVSLLLENSKEYGLSDLQAEKLIKSICG